MRNIFLICLLVLIGCAKQPEIPAPINPSEVIVEDIKVEDESVEVTCEHCGRVYYVRSFDSKPVKKTMEWCFSDGNFCEIGFDLVIDLEKVTSEEEDLAVTIKILEHVETCFGCKAAFFSDSEDLEEAKEKVKEEVERRKQ